MSDSNDPPRAKLNYEPSPGRGPRQVNRRQFWTGLIAGSVCSIIFWGVLFFSGIGKPLVAGFAFLTAKLLAGIALSVSSRWKSAGGGLVISLGVGALIFLGTCGIAVAYSFR